MLRGGEAIQPEQEGKGKGIWGGGGGGGVKGREGRKRRGEARAGGEERGARFEEDEFKGDKDRRQGAPRDRGEMRQVRHSSKDK